MGMFILYVYFVLMALYNVVAGVFVHSVIKRSMAHEKEHKDSAGQTLYEIMRRGKSRVSNTSSEVTKEEFVGFLELPEMKNAVSALDLDVSEATAIFELLDPDRSRTVAVEDLAFGMARFARSVRSADTVPVLLATRRIMKEMKSVNTNITTRFDEL